MDTPAGSPPPALLADNILSLIGGTPLVRLRNLPAPGGAAVWAKCEQQNPGGSVMDRVALAMIEAAEAEGQIRPGRTTIVEPTSGNTGIGLALVCAVKGYRLVVTMPESMSLERRALLRAHGVELVLTRAEDAMAGAVEKAEELCRTRPDHFMPQQFRNPHNPEVHRRTTAVELLAQLDGKHVDAFVCAVGTGGTITGIGHALKERSPSVRVIAVEPAGSPVLSGGAPGPHKIQGIGAGFIPKVLEVDKIDEVVKVENDNAFATARKLARLDGIPGGISTGANVWAALEVAKRPEMAGKRILTFAPSFAERYLSTALFEGV